MPSAIVGTLRVLLSADAAQLETGLGRAGQALNGFSRQAAKAQQDVAGVGTAGAALPPILGRIGPALAGAFSIAAITRVASSFLDMTGALVDLEAKTGISVTGLQRLKLATQESGVELSAVAGAALQLSKRLGEGKDSFVAALERVGLNYEMIRRLSPEEQFFAVADALGKVTDQNDKIALTNALLGKQGQELLPALNGKLKETADAYERMGLVMSEEVIRNGDRLGDQWTVLKSLGAAVIAQVFAPLVSLLAPLAEGFVRVSTAGAPVLKFFLELVGLPFQKAITFIDDLRTSFDLLTLSAEKLPEIKAPVLNVPTAGGLPALSTEEMERIQDELTATARAAIETNRVQARALEERQRALRAYHNFVGERRMEDEAANLAYLETLKAQWAGYWTFLKAQQAATILELRSTFDPMASMEPFKPAITDGITAVTEKTAEWQDQLGTLSTSLSQLAQVAGGTFGGVVRGLATVVTAMDTARNASIAMRQGIAQIGAGGMNNIIGGGINLLSGGLSAAAAVGQATSQGGTGSRVLGGAAAGFQAGMMFGPIGMGVGAAIGGIVGLIRGLSQIPPEVVKARKELEGFQQTLRGSLTDTQKLEAGTEGWRQDVVRVRDAFIAVGRSEAEALAIVRQLWDTDNPDAMRRAMEEINRVLAEEGRLAESAADAIERQRELFEDAQSEASDLVNEIERLAESADGLPKSMGPYIDALLEAGLITEDMAMQLQQLRREGQVDWEAMRASAERYGIDLGSLGARFQGARIGATAQDIINVFGQLTRGGADVGGVLQGMSDEISQLVRDSLRFGTEIPRNMRPWIEELARTGQLLDAQGNKITNLDKIEWGDEMKDEATIAREGFQSIIDKIQELIDRITGPLTQALDKITEDRTIRVDVEFNDPPIPPSLLPGRNVPFEEFGRGGIVTRPTLALIGEKGPEMVIPIGSLPSFDIPIPRVPFGSEFDRTDLGDGNRAGGGVVNNHYSSQPVAVFHSSGPRLEDTLREVDAHLANQSIGTGPVRESMTALIDDRIQAWISANRLSYGF